MTQTIAIANFKGGVGKTTSALNIGAGLARMGKKVLLIDSDPQANLSNSLGVGEVTATLYRILRKMEPIQAIPVAERLWLIPSSLELNKAELELAGEFRREEMLNRLLQGWREQFDFVLIDCPPSLGLLTINAFVASDAIWVPVEAEYLALKGYAILTEAIGAIGLEIDKAFVTKYDHRKVLNRDVKDSISQVLGDKLFKTIIRDNISLAEAPTQALDIFTYQPKSYGALDYEALCSEILELYKK